MLGLAASADLTGLLPKTTISDSTQTTEDMRPGPKHISRNYVASISDCLSQTDLRELFDANESPSNSDADWTSDCSLSSTDLAQEMETSFMAESERTSYDISPENTSFRPTPKRRSGKPLLIEKKFHLELTNRFDCLEVVSPPENSNVNAEFKDRELTTVSQGIRPRSPPKMKPKAKMQEIPKTSFMKSRKSPLTSEIPTSPTQEDVSSNVIDIQLLPTLSDFHSTSDILESHPGNESTPPTSLRSRGTVRCFYASGSSHGFINMDGRSDEDIFFHVNTEEGYYTPKKGDEVSFYYDECGEEAMDVKLELRRTDSRTYQQPRWLCS